MRFYLSKADEAGHESDRQRVMMQIVQELCKRPTLNRTGFDMPTIYIPNPDKVKKKPVIFIVSKFIILILLGKRNSKLKLSFSGKRILKI